MGFDRPSEAGPDTGFPRFKSQEEEDDYREARRQAIEANWPTCGNCWKPAEEVVYIPGSDCLGCADCALEAVALDAAKLSEWFCPERFKAVQRARTVAEVAGILAQHNRTCPQCGGFQKQAVDSAEAA